MQKHFRRIWVLLACCLSISTQAQHAIRVSDIVKDGLTVITDRIMVAELHGSPGRRDIPPVDATTQWRPLSDKQVANFGATEKTRWIKFTVINDLATDQDLMFVFGNHTIYEMRLYAAPDSLSRTATDTTSLQRTVTDTPNLQRTAANTVSLQRTATDATSLAYTGPATSIPARSAPATPALLAVSGIRYPFSHRPYPLFAHTFPLHLRSGANVTYLASLEARGSVLLFIPFLLTAKDMVYQEQKMYISFGILAGIILLTSAFNAFLYFVIRQRIHLLYFIYSIAALWVMLSLETLDFQFFFPNHPQYVILARFASAWLYFGMLISVMQEFLGQNAGNSRLYKAANTIKYICIGAPVAEFIFCHPNWPPAIRSIHQLTYETFILLCLVLIVLSCIEKIRQGITLAWFYLSALLVLIISAALTVLISHNVLSRPGTIMPPTPMEIGLAVEAVIISFGVLYRYNFFKREKERLSQQLQEEKIRTTQEILAAEEQERQRFAQDLHDELGGNLAAIKMTIQSCQLPEAQAATIHYLVDTTAERARNIAHNMMPPDFASTGLKDLLEKHFLRLNGEAGMQWRFHSSNEKAVFSKLQELTIYRIVLELTTNIIRHARATAATFQLMWYEDQLEIMAEDNGIGFDPQQQPAGIGLSNIYSRITYLSGKIFIDSGDKGTTIIIQLPYIIT